MSDKEGYQSKDYGVVKVGINRVIYSLSGNVIPRNIVSKKANISSLYKNTFIGVPQNYPSIGISPYVLRKKV